MITWRYNYVGGGRRVLSTDEIITEPDRFGRWAIIGLINVKTKAMPEYKAFGKTIPVKVAWINRIEREDKTFYFQCTFSYVRDSNIGFCDYNLTADTAGELMKSIEEKMAFTVNCFKNIVVEK